MQKGSLNLIIGCMFSGKSTELIRVCDRYQTIGKRVLYINSYKDTRSREAFGMYKNFHLGHLTTHQNKSIQCIKVHSLNDLLENKDIINDWDVFGIDEGQFFDDLQALIDLVNTYNKIVIVAGLDGDFQQNKFGNIIDLIPQCDNVQKLHALCKNCNDGTPAMFSKRIKQYDNQEMVGGQNEYIAVCRSCR